MIASQFIETMDLIISDRFQEAERLIISYLYTGGISYVIMKWIEDDCLTDENLIAQTVWKQLPSQK